MRERDIVGATVQRIVSLLPSTTEMACLLGLRDRLVGISHECDFPDPVRGLPVLTAPKVDPKARSAEIDRQVREVVASGLSVYRIDEEKLRALRPDLILTQDACAVCAVSFAEVEAAARKLLGRNVEIVSLSPLRLEDVLRDILRVAEAAGVGERGIEAVAGLRARLEQVRARAASARRPRVLALEWMDPPMPAGHWTPELIRIAGGEPVLGREGVPTARTEWDRIREAAPEVLLVIPCGFKIPQTLREMPALVERLSATPAVRSGRVHVADGNAFFNRPGPRLVESAEIALAAIHPEIAGRAFEGDLVTFPR
ncbi:MAG: ABC transporter substrate-binding protein [Myxococcales bacterium]